MENKLLDLKNIVGYTLLHNSKDLTYIIYERFEKPSLVSVGSTNTNLKFRDIKSDLEFYDIKFIIFDDYVKSKSIDFKCFCKHVLDFYFCFDEYL